MARTGKELYRQRDEHILRQPWSMVPTQRPVASKPSRNTARRLRLRRQKNMDSTGKQAQGQAKTDAETELEEGSWRPKGLNLVGKPKIRLVKRWKMNPPGLWMTVIVKMTGHRDGPGLRDNLTVQLDVWMSQTYLTAWRSWTRRRTESGKPNPFGAQMALGWA